MLIRSDLYWPCEYILFLTFSGPNASLTRLFRFEGYTLYMKMKGWLFFGGLTYVTMTTSNHTKLHVTMWINYVDEFSRSF